MKVKKKFRVSRFLTYCFLVLVAFISAFPLYWMLISATNKSIDVIGGTLLPGGYMIENFKNLLKNTYVVSALRNSFVYTIVGCLLNVFVCALAGYGFEIYRTKHKDRLMNLLLLSMMIPVSATLIPLFELFGNLKLLNTYAGYILPMVSTAFMIFFFRQNTRSFPRSTIEAARIDGLSEFAIFFRIYLPMMKSTFAAAATVSFMTIWNSYLWPLVAVQTTDAKTMPLMISSMLDVYVVDYGMLMLGVSLSTLPTIIIFFILQKSFAAGLTGSVKG